MFTAFQMIGSVILKAERLKRKGVVRILVLLIIIHISVGEGRLTGARIFVCV